MAQPAAIIRIKNLRLRTFIGIKEEEINNRQDIVINVTIHYPADKARTKRRYQRCAELSHRNEKHYSACRE